MVFRLIRQIAENKKYKDLDDLANLNSSLKKHHLCLLHSRFSKKQIKKISNLLNHKYHHADREKTLISLVSSVMMDDKYRAYQNVYRYRQLYIFKPFNKVLDFAILSLFRKNWVCGYLALVQILQEILRKWMATLHAGEDYKILFAKVKEKIVFTKSELSEIAEELSNQPLKKGAKKNMVIRTKDGDDYARLKYYSSLYSYLLLVVRDIFGNEVLTGDILSNRNINIHIKKNPNYFCSEINSLRLLIALDAVAELYLWKNKADYLMLNSDLDRKFNSKIYKKYQKFYASSFRGTIKKKSPEELLLKSFYS